MKEKEQSSIEWLIEQFKYTIGRSIIIVMEAEIKEATQLHKKEIIEAVTYGNRQEFYDGTEKIGEKYYTEKYEQ